MSATAAVVERAVATATIATPRGSVSAVVRERAPVATVAAAQGPAGPPGRDAEDGLPPVVAGAALFRGQPIVVSRATRQLLPARADHYVLAFVVGLAATDAQPGFTANPQRGPVEIADWTAIVGTAALAVGQPYFLALTGGLTAIPDRAAACVCRVGTALSPSILVVDPQPPILL